MLAKAAPHVKCEAGWPVQAPVDFVFAPKSNLLGMRPPCAARTARPRARCSQAWQSNFPETCSTPRNWPAFSSAHRSLPSPQPGVLRFGLDEDGDVGIGVLPQREKILIRGAGFIAGGGIFGGIECVSASQAEAGQRSRRIVRYQAVVVDELLKFRRRRVAVVQHEIGFSPQISREQIACVSQLYRARHLQ